MPKSLRKACAMDPWYKICARKGLHGHECAGRITFEHAFIYAGRQINEKWSIVPLCQKAHNCGPWQDRGDMRKEINQWIALNRAENIELLAISKAVDYIRRRDFLNGKYGKYALVSTSPEINGIQYPWPFPEVFGDGDNFLAV